MASPKLTLVLIPMLALAACKGDETRADDDGGINETGTPGDGDGDGDTAGDGDGEASLDMPDNPMVVELKIDPPNAVIEIVDGVIPAELDFTAIAVNDQGNENQVDGSGVWTFDRLDIAALDPAIGGLTATGLLGGNGTLRFSYQGLEAEAQVTVKLSYTFEPDGFDPFTKGVLDTANAADPSLSLLYPYNYTVFPRGLAGPILLTLYAYALKMCWTGRVAWRGTSYTYTPAPAGNSQKP